MSSHALFADRTAKIRGGKRSPSYCSSIMFTHTKSRKSFDSTLFAPFLSVCHHFASYTTCRSEFAICCNRRKAAASANILRWQIFGEAVH